MTTVIECHPAGAAKPAADLKISKSTIVNGVDTGKLSDTIRREVHLLPQYVALLLVAVRKAIRLTLSIVPRVKGNLNED